MIDKSKTEMNQNQNHNDMLLFSLRFFMQFVLLDWPKNTKAYLELDCHPLLLTHIKTKMLACNLFFKWICRVFYIWFYAKAKLKTTNGNTD